MSSAREFTTDGPTLKISTFEIYPLSDLRTRGRLNQLYSSLFPIFMSCLYRPRGNRSLRRQEENHPWMKLTARTMAKLLTPRMFAGFRLHYPLLSGIRLVRGLISTHNTNEVLIPHLFYRDVVHQTRNDSPRTRLFPKVYLLYEL